MTNAELIKKIKAEIKRMLLLLGQGYDEIDRGQIAAYEHLFSFLSTLESEKPMNLEEEINLWISENENIHHGDKLMVWLLKEVARYFAEWGKEQGYREGFLEGTKIQREEDNQLVDIIYQQGIEKGKDEIRETLKKEEKK